MEQIKPSKNAHQWPRHEVKQLQLRKIDLVVRITDWMKDRDEPGYDVEVYIGGVYDWHQSETFTLYALGTHAKCKDAAKQFAAKKISELL